LDIVGKMRIQTLIHEIVHIIKSETGIKDLESETEMDEKQIYEVIFGDKAFDA